MNNKCEEKEKLVLDFNKDVLKKRMQEDENHFLLRKIIEENCSEDIRGIELINKDKLVYHCTGFTEDGEPLNMKVCVNFNDNPDCI